jgi:hypothetical protein
VRFEVECDPVEMTTCDCTLCVKKNALMVRVPEAGPAILLGLRIATDVLSEHGAPAVRVGLHHGPAVERDGDYFGATVNLAARVSGAAVGGEVLTTASTAALAPSLPGVVYESRGRHDLRNVREPVELVAAVRVGGSLAEHLVVDPVCRMTVDPDRAAGMVLLTGLGVDAGYTSDILPALQLLGVGMGLVMSTAMNNATLGVQASDAGVASAMVSASQQVGGSIGTALLSTLASSAATSFATSAVPGPGLMEQAAVHGYTTAFAWAAVLFAVGAVVSGLLFERGAPVLELGAEPVLAH